MWTYRLIGCLLGLALCGSAAAQGFNTFSGRNHPELDWRVATTEHFEIMYPARLAGIEAEAAPIAEASYDALTANFDVTFDERIRIYLSDEDEIGNGFAVPIGTGYTAIWVHHNDIATNWTGRAKWLRKVIAHELAHIVHYKATESNLGWLGRLIGNPTPRFWTEGLAQYETEQWDAQRGDRWLRAAVLDDALSYRDGRSLWNGRLLYAVGNAQTRYLAAQYGDSTLTDLLAHRDTVLFGLGRVHDFESALQATTGQSYRAFYDDWRRHMNVYYNTMAGQLETLDSLGVDLTGRDSTQTAPLSLPGRYLSDVQYSPDTSRIAVLSVPSPERPVRRLHVVDPSSGGMTVVAEGAIEPPVAWHPDGTQLAFARRTRGRNGSLLNDLFLAGGDGDNLRRLTHSRRAHAPTFAPDGERLAFIGLDDGTANLFTLDLASGTETQITDFSGDVQLAHARWHPSRDTVAVARVQPDGTRDIILVDVETGAITPVTDGQHDDRQPTWAPDGSVLAYTSLRDGVPNVFATDLASGTHRRVTQLALGATVHDWLPPDSAAATGRLALVTTVSKQRDRAYTVRAERRTSTVIPDLPSNYTDWTTHRPPRTVPLDIAPDPSLIQQRGDYRSWANLTHVGSLTVPYYFGPDDAGLFGFTSWTEPLGKHTIGAGGVLSLADPSESGFLASYVNNQLRPTVSFNGYRLPGSARIYSDDLLVEEVTGGDITAQWPLDWRTAPYLSTRLGVRLRYVDLEPLNPEDFESPDVLPPPAAGQQADVQLALVRQKLRPYRDNLIHPLGGWGVRLQATGAARVLGSDTEFLRGDVAAYRVLPGLSGRQRLYVYGRAQAQTGDPFPQDFLGFTRYDDIQIGLPGLVPITLGDAERVRGYRSYALGNRVLFGSVEYRVPLVPSLQTEVLGAIGLGSTTLAAFADGGLVWSGGGFSDAVQRAGVGLEVKNALRLGGVRVAHALGVAQPAEHLGTEREIGLYYRVQTALPF